MDNVPASEFMFLIFLFSVCCLAESILKSSFFIKEDSDDISTLYDNMEVVVVRGIDETTQPLKDIIDVVSDQHISKSKYYIIRVASSIFGVLFAVSIEASRWIIYPGRSLTMSMMIYIVISFLTRFYLATFIYHYLGESIIQLYSRCKQSVAFNRLTTPRLGTGTGGGGGTGGNDDIDHGDMIPYISMATITDIQSWQIIRSKLLKEFRQPKLFVDVTLSACFAIWLPIIALSILLLLIKGKVSMIVISCLSMGLIMFLYLAVCMVLAARARDGFNNVDVIDDTTMKMWWINADSCKSQELGLLAHIKEMMVTKKNEAVVFRIMGIDINKNLVTVLFSIMATAATTVVSKLLQ
jgi:hypothetical protein